MPELPQWTLTAVNLLAQGFIIALGLAALAIAVMYIADIAQTPCVSQLKDLQATTPITSYECYDLEIHELDAAATTPRARPPLPPRHAARALRGASPVNK